MMRKINRDNTGKMRAGQDLVVVGYVGLAGSVEAAKARKEELLRWFSLDYLEELEPCVCKIKQEQKKTKEEFLDQFEAAECEPVGEGGILSALWRLSGAYETGIGFALREIPIRQETIEICERLNLNPYRLYSQNCWLLAAESGHRLAKRLEQAGLRAAVIGTVHTGIVREMTVETGTSFLERPQPDELLKILPDFVFEKDINGLPLERMEDVKDERKDFGGN